jgi:hypothetical protein
VPPSRTAFSNAESTSNGRIFFPVNSLFVPCYFVRLGTLNLCKLRVSVDLQRVGPRQRVKFPVNFPVNGGEEFARDCVLRQPVWPFLSVGALRPEKSILRAKRPEFPAHHRPLVLQTPKLPVNRAVFLRSGVKKCLFTRQRKPPVRIDYPPPISLKFFLCPDGSAETSLFWPDSWVVSPTTLPRNGCDSRQRQINRSISSGSIARCTFKGSILGSARIGDILQRPQVS